MKHSAILISLFYSITLLGCHAISRVGYGAHKSGDTENKTTILAWLNEKAQINAQSVYTVVPNQFYYAATRFETGPFIFGPDRRYIAIGRANGAFCPLNFDYYLATVKPLEKSPAKWDDFLVLPQGLAQPTLRWFWIQISCCFKLFFCFLLPI